MRVIVEATPTSSNVRRGSSISPDITKRTTSSGVWAMKDSSADPPVLNRTVPTGGSAANFSTAAAPNSLSQYSTELSNVGVGSLSRLRLPPAIEYGKNLNPPTPT